MTGTITYPTGVVSSELARIARVRTEALSLDALPDVLNVLQWIQLFDPYVKTGSQDGGRIFTLDEQSTGLPEDNEYLTQARICCAIANAMPASQRPSKVAAIEKRPYDVKADAACVPHGNYTPYWWGYTYYYDHCAIADIQLKLTIGGGVATVIAALAGGVPAIVVGAMAAWWQIDSQWMATADSHCNNAGADLSATWAAPGVFWVKPMC